jgi:type IV secretion system protein VirD4
MNYKTEKSLNDNKKYFIVFLVLWLILAIVLIAPIATGTTGQTAKEGQQGLEAIFDEITSFSAITRVFGNSETITTFGKDLGIFTVIYVIAVILGLIKSRPKNEFTDIEHGSSGWCQNGEQYRILSRDKGIQLAEKHFLPIDKQGNVNVLVVGGSGAGKSTSYVFPNAYQCLGSYVFTDPKGEIYDTTAGYLKEHGYNIKVLNLVSPENSDGYNPLAHIRSQVDVDIIAHTIVTGQGDGGGKQDPYWDNTAEMLLKSLIYYLISTRPPEEQNLVSCAELVRAADSSGGSGMLNDLINELDPDNPARTNYKNIANASDKTFGNILSTLQSKLGKFDSKDIAAVTSTDTMDFEELAKTKTALYVMSSDTHSTYDFLLTIFFAQMIQQLYDYADHNGGKLGVPMYFILDEFANIGQIPDFDKKISTSRSRKISFSVILQNLDQLEAVYKESYETIIGNCDTHLFLGSNSFKTVEYFSKQLGETTISRESISTNRDKTKAKTGYSESDQLMGRALMTPDEMRRMPTDECIIFEKGLRPIKAKKFYYFNHKGMYNALNSKTINHVEYVNPNRGNWRKFNPMNPYVEGQDENKTPDLKVESLDDLFDDIPSGDATNKVEQPATVDTHEQAVNDMAAEMKVSEPVLDLNSFGENKAPQGNVVIPQTITTPVEPEVKEEVKEEIKPVIEEAPVLPTEPISVPKPDPIVENDMFSEDLQAKLEAKFDELFGPITMDDGNNNN